MKTSVIALVVLSSFTLLAEANEARSVQREVQSRGVSDSGTNIGGGNSGSEYLSVWCKGQSSLLRNVRDRAYYKLDKTGDYNAANKILTEGMVQALANSQSANSSFLYKSLTRGLAIATHLDTSLGGNPEKKALNANNILNRYYEFMLDVVAKNLDLEGHIPYLNATNAELDQRSAHYEESFVNYANNQLTWILRNLVSTGRIGTREQPVPVGDARIVLKVALTLTEATADDLEDSLWSYRFGCSISDLRMLNKTIKAYDQGNKEMFEDEKQAFTYTVSELRRISDSINSHDGCR